MPGCETNQNRRPPGLLQGFYQVLYQMTLPTLVQSERANEAITNKGSSESFFTVFSLVLSPPPQNLFATVWQQCTTL